jgi:carboxyl-terminal processing protease
LPWDVIKKTDFQKTTDVTDQLVAGLEKKYQGRLKSDASLKRYVGEIDEIKKNLSETRISLNEATRKKEMEEAEKKKVSDNLDTKLTSKEGLPVDDISKMKDEYLREGLLILSDILTRYIG